MNTGNGTGNNIPKGVIFGIRGNGMVLKLEVTKSHDGNISYWDINGTG